MRSALPYLLAGLLLSAGLAPAGLAQEHNPQSPPAKPLPPGGSPGSNNTPDQPSPGSPSEELNQSGGVLKPPPTPDAGVMSPPSEGSSDMPVIPPPGPRPPSTDGRQ
jgi:hypothetical protein